MDKKILLMLLLIIAFGIFLRAYNLTKSPVAYEPDNLFYLSVANQTIANHYAIPNVSVYSGFPIHNKYDEGIGLIYLAVIPYYFLHWTGLGLVDMMHLVQLIFGILGILIAYKFAVELSGGNQTTGLLAGFLYATLPAAIFKGFLNEIRGESFVPVILAGALLLLLLAYKEESNTKKISYIILSLILMIANLYIWNGAIYTLVVYVFIIFLVLLYWITSSTLYSQDTRKALWLTIGIAVLAIASLWVIYTHSTLLGAFFSAPSSNVALTTSETQTPTLAFWISNFLIAFFLMWFAIVGYVFHKRENYQVLGYLFLLAILFVGLPEALTQDRWGVLIAMPVAIFASLFIHLLFEYRERFNFSDSKINQMLALVLLIGILVPLYQFLPVGNPTGVSNTYHLTLDWVQNNTASNSTFLTEWDDGSAIEAWGSRQSYTDSVGGENGIKIAQFSDFLAQPAGNFSYLAQVKPNYLLVRNYWSQQINSILIQGNLSTTTPLRGSNFNLLINETPNQTSSTNGTIVLKKVYEEYNNTIYSVNISRPLPIFNNSTQDIPCITEICIQANESQHGFPNSS